MKNPLRKLHTSEVLLLAAYAVGLVSYFLLNENDAAIMILFCLVSITALSIWSMVRLKVIPPILYPYYIFLGMTLGSLFGNTGMVVWFVLGLFILSFIFVHLVICLSIKVKGFHKMLIMLVLSFSIVFALDRIFITLAEINAAGEKGPDFYMDKYADWRVIGE